VQNHQHRNREKGASLFIAIAALVWVVIPMLGLFIDLGILYSAKARLQAAVDGAALAAARALALGSNTTAQATSAQQNAVSWFYANFPPGNWNTNNTVMTTANVTVTDAAAPSHLRQVQVTAQTNVPAWFMQWLGFKFTTLNVTGTASRKDVVAMLVLDRSGSMCSINGANPVQPCGANDGTPCAAMITAAKNFTGAFAEGRDQIGMLTFSDGYYLDQAPTVNFQTALGYSNTNNTGDPQSGAGDIDTITCAGGTGTPAAISMAYNQLYQIAEPGAMNILMIETDGLPNTVLYNFYPTPSANRSTLALNANSGCQDTAGKSVASGQGWTTAASVPAWTSGISLNNPAAGFMADVPSGAIGAFYTADPSQGPPYFNIVLFDPRQTTDTQGLNNAIYVNSNNNGPARGCSFSQGNDETYSDFNWLPSQDVFGNQVDPANAYTPLALTNVNGVNVNNLTGTIATDWPHTHAAALNATDNAAYNARANATLPVTIFVIGLGGNHGDPPDPILLQRMANDPYGDQFNVPPNPNYTTCSAEPTCINYPNQPQGQFIYSPGAAQLGEAFLAITSQILRLSH
jgi:Flp pilus assembly protein TadG